MIKKIVSVLRTRGVVGLLGVIATRVSALLPKRAQSFQENEALFRGKKGMEIGGASQVFSKQGLFPVYPIVGHLDKILSLSIC
jgi:hypothetical protein